MISKFQPATRFALIVSVALLITLGCFTFTRAADKPNDPPKKSNSASSTPTEPAPNRTTNATETSAERQKTNHFEQTKAVSPKEAQSIAANRRIAVLTDNLLRLERQMREQQVYLNALRWRLAIPNEIAEGNAVSKIDAETMRHLEAVRQDLETQYLREQKLLAQLKLLNSTELKNALPTAAPDAILSQLLQDQLAAKTKLVTLRSDFGEENPVVTRVVSLQKELDKQIDERLKGILSGMEMHVNSLKAVVDDVNAGIDAAKKDDSESFEKYQPYFQGKHKLEILQKTFDALATRQTQEEIELDLMKNAPPYESSIRF